MMRLRISLDKLARRQRDREPEMQAPLCNFWTNGTSRLERRADPFGDTAAERGLFQATRHVEFRRFPRLEREVNGLGEF